MKKHAILLRLNPRHWPKWECKLAQGNDIDVWFTTGRRCTEDIHRGIPVVVLGTDNLGVIACGETSSCVERRPDPDWEESPLEYQPEGEKAKNRVCVKIRRVKVPLIAIKERPSIANLYRTVRETTTWLTEEQYQEFFNLSAEHNFSSECDSQHIEKASPFN